MEIFMNMKYSFIIGMFLLFIFSCDSSNPVGVQCGEGLTEVDGQCFDDCNVLDGDGSSCSCDDVVCTPSSSCVTSSCVEGSCVESDLANGEPCSDGNACTLGDFCDQGTCLGMDISCDDGNPCSEDSCNITVGCIYDYTSYNGMTCDDGDACTSTDACNEGACSGSVITDCP
ncbi:MAG: hypothetical protein CMP60_07135 [Flavobacteriales bacterium]|nr:hypothetical protein [Flavobacteriales bacterium]|tara:strand:+ start:681 stop:1196 length:516 start_codon:yes stop_codon:yes gene_type:complete